MNKYLVVSLMMITGLLGSCVGDGRFGMQGPGGWGPMMHYGFGYGGMYMWIILVIVIGVIIYFYVKSQNTKDQTPTRDESHLDILKQRYAKGDITKEEFDQMKKDLKED
jgi:putative membrane protein